MHINVREQRKPAMSSSTNEAFVRTGDVILSSVPWSGGAGSAGEG